MSKVSDQTWVEAYLRQEGICGDCGDADTALNAHHMKRQADGGSDLTSNIVLVCDDCHYAAHDYGNYQKPLETTSENFDFFSGKKSKIKIDFDPSCFGR